jgi:hypothetical protein
MIWLRGIDGNTEALNMQVCRYAIERVSGSEYAMQSLNERNESGQTYFHVDAGECPSWLLDTYDLASRD